MENISVQHRLLGKEDLFLDVNNANETGTFTSPLGGELVTTAINAKHVPLGAEAAAALGATDVSSAIILLDYRIDQIGTSQNPGATADKTIEVDSLSASDITAIGTEISTWTTNTKKMNGHTLTIKLTPQSSSITAQGILAVRGLSNGTVVIDLNGKTLSNAITSDDCVVMFSGCQCVCKVTNGTVNHTEQDFAVKFYNSYTGIADGVIFSGTSANGYAISAIGCPLSVKTCTFATGKVYIGTYTAGSTYEIDGQAFTLTDVTEEVQELEEKVDELEEKIEGNEEYVVETGHSGTSGNCMTWSLTNTGRLEIWGTTTLTTYGASQKWVHLVDFGSVTGYEYEDTEYTIVTSPIQDNQTYLTFNDSGDVTGVTMSRVDSSYVSIAKESTDVDKFYIVAKSDPGVSSYNGAVSWHTIGQVGTSAEEE